MSYYTFDSDSLKYFLNKLKELFTLNSEADLKVDQVNGKDLVTNDYTDEYAQLNNKIINDITISDKTDTEVTLTFGRKNGDSSSIRIPYDKYKKSALFVDAPEKLLCSVNEERKINYRYISSLKDGNHRLVVEIVKSTGTNVSHKESYTYDEIPDNYLYVPEEDDVALKMYFIDPENTMTGVTYLEPEAAYLVAKYTAKNEIVPAINHRFEEVELTYDGNPEGKETLVMGNWTFVKIYDDVTKYDFHDLITKELEITERPYGYTYTDTPYWWGELSKGTNYFFTLGLIFVAAEDLTYHYEDPYEGFDEMINIKKGIWIISDEADEDESYKYYVSKLKYNKTILPNDIEYELETSVENDLYHISLYLKDYKDITSISFVSQDDLISVEELKTENLINIDYMFAGCTSITSLEDLNYSSWNLEKVQYSSHLFDGCEGLNTSSTQK